MRHQHGFTLIELIISLVLATVLVTLATPVLTGLQARRALDATVGTFFSDVVLARAEAIRRGNFVTICQSNTGLGCTDGDDWRFGWILFEGVLDPAATLNGAPVPAILRVQGRVPGIWLMQLNQGLGWRRLTFSPTGVGITAGGRLQLVSQADPAITRLVCFSGTGLFSLRPPEANRC